jgi:hypothetical protein
MVVICALACTPDQGNDPFAQLARQFFRAAVLGDSITMVRLSTEAEPVTFILHQDSTYLDAASRHLQPTRQTVYGDTALVSFRFRNGNQTELIDFEFRLVSGRWLIRGVMQPT